jgi:hypothetical protein
MFENIENKQFLRICVKSLQKVLRYDPQKIFLKEIKLGFKNAEFCADFKFGVMLT